MIVGYAMPGLRFTKMHGCGNDFIMIDGRGKLRTTRLDALAARLCDRRRGLGADGLVVLYPPRSTADFAMRYVNASGMQGEMCGNGARCAARFAHDIGMATAYVAFETDAGLMHAEVEAASVTLVLPPPTEIRMGLELSLGDETLLVHAVRVGVPHAVVVTDDVAGYPVDRLGPLLRSHPHFPEGCNANFISITGGEIMLRTFERGVEAETLACGTGAVASATVAFLLGLDPISGVVRTRGGNHLHVALLGSGDGFTGATLSGPTETVARGEVDAGYLKRHGLYDGEDAPDLQPTTR